MIVPQFSFTTCHIPIDTDALYDIISEAGLNNGMDKMQFGDEALVQWSRFFKVEQLGDNFGCYIETDGI
ncbi:8728_t:CDS:2 [Entrophospora sp. SA101]|nr:8728_t:CDS:2 [Entrophospora sp. SA101]